MRERGQYHARQRVGNRERGNSPTVREGSALFNIRRGLDKTIQIISEQG